MSQRNPMNDRYTTDDKKGQTRKSAASAKPKTKAASSVHIKSNKPTKKEKKAIQKKERAKTQDTDRKYYNPPTPEYKRLRRIWWVMLIVGIVMIALSWGARSWFPELEVLSYVILAIAYISVIGAFVLDLTKIRKVRRAYQDLMVSQKSKEQRSTEKKEKAEQLAKKSEEAKNPDEKTDSQSTGVKGAGNRIFEKLMGKNAASASPKDTAAKDDSAKDATTKEVSTKDAATKTGAKEEDEAASSPETKSSVDKSKKK